MRSVLRGVVDAATPGPWNEVALGSEGYVVTAPPNDLERFGGIRRPTVARCGNEAWEVDKANAAYIAAFDPVTMTAALDIIEAALVVDYELLHVIDEYPETQDLINACKRWRGLRQSQRERT